MKKISTLLLWVLSLFTLQAQEKPFTQWAAGINGGLYGAGIQGATNLSPHFKLRAGFDYFALNRQDVATFEAEMEDYDQTVEAEITKASVTFPNCKVMIDYYPMRNGIFSLTAGFYTGTNRAEADGMIPGYEELTQEMGEKPTLEYEDIVFEPYDDGSFDALLKMGNSLKPYLGIGLGRSIPKNRVGVRFELGLVYQGKYKLESDNLNEAGRDWVNRMADELAISLSQLNRRLNSVAGKPSSTYILHVKMSHARKILSSQQKTIGEVAAECGIFDVNYFSRIFKKHTGLTPTQYQRLPVKKEG